MKDTKIEWCDSTVNVWTGCREESEACQNCYARTMTRRFAGSNKNWNCWGDSPRWIRTDSAIDEIQRLNRAARKKGIISSVFVNSMSDFFEDCTFGRKELRRGRYPNTEILDDARRKFLEAAVSCKNLCFLFLTKRARGAKFALSIYGDYFGALDHFAIGFTAENQTRLDERMEEFLRSRIEVKNIFLSVEPMLGSIDISKYANKISWVICGGETGPKARPFSIEKAFVLYIQCLDLGIPFFFKSFGKNPVCIRANTSHIEGIEECLRKSKQFPEWLNRPGLTDTEAPK